MPTETVAQGPWGGPVYSYRGAEIRCNPGGHVCTLLMPEHPLHGLPSRPPTGTRLFGG